MSFWSFRSFWSFLIMFSPVQGSNYDPRPAFNAPAPQSPVPGADRPALPAQHAAGRLRQLPVGGGGGRPGAGGGGDDPVAGGDLGVPERVARHAAGLNRYAHDYAMYFDSPRVKSSLLSVRLR